MHRTIAGLVFAFSLAWSAPALAIAYIQANCTVDASGPRCVFTNTGSDAGSACATMHVANRLTQQATDSALLCSGTLQPQASVMLPAAFPGVQPSAVCLGGAMPAWSNCALDVRMSNARAEGSNLWSILLTLVVLFTSAWVYTDAKRIGARKGLVTGLGNASPAGWLVASLLLWIVAFPLYLAMRGKLKAAALAASGAAQGSFPQQGFPPSGGFQGGPPFSG